MVNKNIIRKDAVLYNIFDSRNEGVATSVEEMFTIDPAPRLRMGGITACVPIIVPYKLTSKVFRTSSAVKSAT